MSRRLYNLVELDYVRVSHQFQDVEFTGYSLDISNLYYLFLVQDFYRYFLLGKQMNSFFNFAESTLT